MPYKVLGATLKALSDPNRLKIVDILSYGEKCANDILKELDITQPTLSHHMKVLQELNLVVCRKSGLWRYYSLNHEEWVRVHEVLSYIYNEKI